MKLSKIDLPAPPLSCDPGWNRANGIFLLWIVVIPVLIGSLCLSYSVSIEPQVDNFIGAALWILVLGFVCTLGMLRYFQPLIERYAVYNQEKTDYLVQAAYEFRAIRYLVLHHQLVRSSTGTDVVIFIELDGEVQTVTRPIGSFTWRPANRPMDYIYFVRASYDKFGHLCLGDRVLFYTDKYNLTS